MHILIYFLEYCKLDWSKLKYIWCTSFTQGVKYIFIQFQAIESTKGEVLLKERLDYLKHKTQSARNCGLNSDQHSILMQHNEK